MGVFVRGVDYRPGVGRTQECSEQSAIHSPLVYCCANTPYKGESSDSTHNGQGFVLPSSSTTCEFVALCGSSYA